MWFSCYAYVRRIEWVGCLMVVGLSALLTTFSISQLTAERQQADLILFDRLIDDFQAQLRSREFVIEQLADAIEQVPELNAQSWQSLSQGFFDEYPESAGIGWVDYVTAQQLPEFQTKQAQRSITLMQLDPESGVAPLETRDDYGILTYLTANQSGPSPLGLDLFSEPQRELMLRRALSSDDTVISQPIELSTHAGETAILLAHPVRSASLSGFITGAFLSEPLIKRLLPRTEEGAVLVIQDPSSPARPLYPRVEPTNLADRDRFRAYIDFGQRTWQVALTQPNRQIAWWPHLIWTTTTLALLVALTLAARARQSEHSYQKRLARATLKLTQTNTALTYKNRELEAFAYAASHDLQAPLRGIRNLTQWLTEDLGEQQLTDEAQDFLSRLSLLSVRMSEMIAGLLDFSRVSGEGRVLEWVNVSELVDESCPSDQRHRVHVDIPTELKTYRLSLQRVLAILIENSLTHNGPLTQVWISIPPGRPDYIWIADNGHGIKSHQAERVFEIFQTLDSDADEKVRGMGLPIARKIARTLNGSLELVQHPDLSGACFELHWPCPKRRNHRG